MKIQIVRERLSDGSFVFNIHVPAAVIAAESESAAQRFADTLAELCNAANVHDDDAEVAFGY
jgi:hypothetical protein